MDGYLHFFRKNSPLKRILTILLMALCWLLSPLSLTAQHTTSAISGNVSDGKTPIQEAVVTIVHEPTGTHYYVFTNKQGNYVINNILVGGPYTVRVERLNYKSLVVQGVEAPIGETVVVDAILNPSPSVSMR